MNNWKVLITDGLNKQGRAILENYTEIIDHTGISAEDLLEKVSESDALIVRGRTKVTTALLEAAPNLKVVGRAGVGVDNIDLATAQSRGVTVVNAPTATTIAVAEHTLALIFSLFRHIGRADDSMKSGLWNKKELAGIEAASTNDKNYEIGFSHCLILIITIVIILFSLILKRDKIKQIIKTNKK